MYNMYNKIPYVLVFRGESFRFNNKKGDRRTINDPTEQINALKSVKKNVVDHWSHKYKLDHVIASTYSTKFDNLLKEKLSEIFNVKIIFVTSSKSHSTQITTIKNSFKYINISAFIIRFDAMLNVPFPMEKLNKVLFAAWHYTGKPQCADPLIWIPKNYLEKCKIVIRERWYSHYMAIMLKKQQVDCDVFFNIRIRTDQKKGMHKDETIRDKRKRPWILVSRGYS